MLRRLRTTTAWMGEPFVSLGVLLPMVLSLAVPPLFVAAGQRFERAAADAVAQQLLDEVPRADQGLTVVTNGLFRRSEVRAVDDQISQRLAAAPALDRPVLTLYSSRGEAVVVRARDEAPEIIRASPRFFARAGAIDSLTMLDETDDFQGVYVSEDFAEQGQLGVGSAIDVQIGNAGAVVQVQGIYQDLWPTPPPYWDDVPPELVPRWDPFFRRVSSEPLILREDLLLELGVNGLLRWDAPPAHDISTLAELDGVADQFTSVEDDLVRDPSFTEALAAFAGLEAPTPTVTSSMSAILRDAQSASGSLDRPLASSQTAGITLGLLIVAAGASFRARRRRVVWNVLTSSGDGPVRIAGLAFLETLVPAALATTLAVGGSALATAAVVPGGIAGLDAIRLRSVFAVSLLSVIVSVIVTTAIAARSRTRENDVGNGYVWALLPLVGFAIAGWIQAGSTAANGRANFVVVAVPIAVLSAAAGIAMLLLQAIIRRVNQRGSRTSVPVMLGLRRIASGSSSLIVLAAALAVSFGLTVYANILSETRDSSVAAKSATVTGSQSAARLVGNSAGDAELPSGSSLVRLIGAPILPGDLRVQVIAIDPETFSDVVAWPEEFGDLDPDEITTLLAPRDDGEISAIRLASRPVPTRAAFGSNETFPYRIVGEVESAPFVSGARPALIIRADALDEAGLARFVTNYEREFSSTPTPADIEQFYESPLVGFGRQIMSSNSAADLQRDLDDASIGASDVIDRSEVGELVSTQATRWAFTYLQFVGLVCAAASLAGTLLYARERRAGRDLADRVGATLGATRQVSAKAAGLEFGLVALASLIPGVIAALAVANRLAPTFETLADVTPTVRLDVPIQAVALGALVSFTLIVVAGIGTELAGWGRADDVD